MVETSALPWHRVLRRTLFLLLIWFTIGPLLGILLVDRLNAMILGDLPLGFWISQQGSIYIFVILIFVNAWLADREAGAMEEPSRVDQAITADRPGGAPRVQRDPGV